MCLAVPMQVAEIDGAEARCEARGVSRRVSLLLLEPGSVRCGDYVMVHVGTALQIIAPHDAEIAWSLYDEMLAEDA